MLASTEGVMLSTLVFRARISTEFPETVLPVPVAIAELVNCILIMSPADKFFRVLEIEHLSKVPGVYCTLDSTVVPLTCISINAL